MDVIATAMGEVLEPFRLLMLFVGVCTGLVIGVIPGIGGLFGMALLIPMTYSMDPYAAIALLLGMASVTTTSDTIPAVLIGVPGTVGSMATVVDGHQLAKKGDAARALGAAYSASLIGGLFGALVLAISLPVIRPFILMLRTPDFLAISVLGLSFVAMVSGKQPLKGLAAALVGVAASLIGLDDHEAIQRWTFGQLYLWDGLSLSTVFLGVFGIPEVASLYQRKAISENVDVITGSGMLRGMRETLSEWWLVLRCSSMGALVGAMPGIGLAAVSWITYAMATRNRGDGPPFGEGNIRGVIGPEAANNATEGGSLIPTIALGIPGGAGTALLLGALIVHGVVPGPHMLGRDAPLTVAMIFCVAAANVIGALICLFLTNPLARLATVSSKTIAPIALVFLFMGAFQASASIGDIVVLFLFGLIGMFMKSQGWSRPALALGFVLGPVIERYFFLSYQINGWDFLSRPAMLLVVVFFLYKLAVHLKAQSVPVAAVQEKTDGHDTDMTVTAGLLVLSVFILASSKNWPFAAAVFPIVSGGLLFVLAVVMLVSGGIRRSGSKTPQSTPGAGSTALVFADERRAGLAILSFTAAMTAGLYAIGPFLSSGLLVTSVMLYVGKKPVPQSISTGIGVAIVVYLIFDRMVSVAWPLDGLSLIFRSLF